MKKYREIETVYYEISGTCFGTQSFIKECAKVLQCIPDKYFLMLDDLWIIGLQKANGFLLPDKVKENKIVVISEEGIKPNLIAHELAHAFLEHNKVLDPFSKNFKIEEANKIEREANHLIKKWGFEPANEFT